MSDLSTTDHSRDAAGLRYVYPVVSRRAGGVSVGINLNTDNACNWRCIYCQVPGLVRGTAPPVDLNLLENELRGFFHELAHGDFMARRVQEGAQRINDIALSGNGEPTSAAEFLQVIELIGKLKQEGLVPAGIKLVLITNGSLMHREYVQQGLRRMAALDGEVWFKLDSGSETGMCRINGTQAELARVRRNLATAIALCPTWLQTCWFLTDGEPPSEQDENDYLEFISSLAVKPEGVLLYSIARPSMQPEAPHLAALDVEKLEGFAQRIRAQGLIVKVSP